MTNQEIIDSNEFNQLYGIKRHVFSNTAEHSLRVAKYMKKMARLLKFDREAAERVGLLHDLCFVDGQERKQLKEQKEQSYLFFHPSDALKNANQLCGDLSADEENAIETHMFPLSKHRPRGRLSWCLTVADKMAAVSDFVVGLLVITHIGM